MTLLTYKERYIISDTTHNVTSTSNVLADDTYAIKNDLVLTKTQVVLVIYESYSDYFSTNKYTGRATSINVDGTNHSFVEDSASSDSLPSRNFNFWVGTLDAGTHVIIGKFAANLSGYTVTINARSLLIYVFDGDTTSFKYIDNLTGQTRSSSTYSYDAYAQTTFTPSSACNALILYSMTTLYTATSDSAGTSIAIYSNGSPCSNSVTMKSSGAANRANSMTAIIGLSLSSSETTIKGAFASISGNQVSISRSCLAVLLFNNDVELDCLSDTTAYSTTGTSLVNDPYLTISRVFQGGEVLVIATATKYYNVSTSAYGMGYGLMLDDVNKCLIRNSPCSADTAESNTLAWGETVGATPEPHVIKGIFSSNMNETTTTVSRRIGIALWFPTTSFVQISGSGSGSGTVTTANVTVSYYFTCNVSGIGAIITSHMAVSYYITGSGTGTGSITLAHPTLNYRITGSGTGTGSITLAHPTLLCRITGGGTGTGSVTTANTKMFKHILSSISGLGTITIAHPTLLCRITGGGTGTGSITIAHAILSTRTNMVSTNTSTGVVVKANVTLFNKISCSVSGSGSITLSHMYRFVRILSSSTSLGTSSCTSLLTEYIHVSSELTGSGSSTTTGYLAQSVSVVGSGTGIGNSTATHHKFLHIISNLTGIGSSTATHNKFIHIISNVTGTGNSTSTGKYFDHLISNLTGTGNSTSVGKYFDHLVSNINGIGIGTNYLYVGSTLRCVVSGSGTCNVRTHLYLNILGTGTGIGLQLGLCGIVEDLTSNVSGTGDSSSITNILKGVYSHLSGTGSSNIINNMLLSIIGSEVGVGSCSNLIEEFYHITAIATGTGKSFGIVGVSTCNNSTIRVIPTEFLHAFFFPIEFLWTAEIVRLNIDASELSILVTYPTFDIEIIP